ncbi:hypothetical protein BC834DRAFT_495337 [Gloeopeniophorella convolvens]|nr:hypothetical protein BC834DRAFT_495337 [Gloeopeniophorella convolvens]
MTDSKIQIRRVFEDSLTESEKEEITDVFADSFKNDPFFRMAGSVKPDIYRRIHHSAWLAAIRGGQLYVATYDGVLAGGAAWFPPGTALLAMPQQGKGGFNELLADFDEAQRKWFLEYFMPKYDVQYTQALGKGAKLASWHLQILGVRERFHRHGIGRALIEHVKPLAQADGVPLCLDTQNPNNVPYYQARGFALKSAAEGERYEHPLGSFQTWVFATESA